MVSTVPAAISLSAQTIFVMKCSHTGVLRQETISPILYVIFHRKCNLKVERSSREGPTCILSLVLPPSRDSKPLGKGLCLMLEPTMERELITYGEPGLPDG